MLSNLICWGDNLGKQITARTRSQLYFYAMREVVMVLKCCVHSLFQFHPSSNFFKFWWCCSFCVQQHTSPDRDGIALKFLLFQLCIYNNKTLDNLKMAASVVIHLPLSLTPFLQYLVLWWCSCPVTIRYWETCSSGGKKWILLKVICWYVNSLES